MFVVQVTHGAVTLIHLSAISSDVIVYLHVLSDIFQGEKRKKGEDELKRAERRREREIKGKRIKEEMK